MRLIRIWIGLVLLALGVLGVLDAVGVASFGATAGRWWPIAVIGLGLAGMAAARRISLGPSLVAVLGLVLLAGQLEWTQGSLFWPALLLVAGAILLTGIRSRRVKDRTDSLVMFGGGKTVNRAEHLEHADVSALLGGATLDLRQAHIDREATVDALAVLGGVDVLVPKDWRVEIDGLPILGGFDDKTEADGSAGGPLLKVNATAVLGGVNVANEPG
ncbi:LiaF transmembrane domain-containing protein [Amycolatopsis alkalitolerans]|uniref:LiaF transmembrane domain-containing protein n=1 Tax=Amycolatopsis alkalitolerans TaxID=2547244 RepID=A0A5C4M6W7_9PSEU|nr:LiaF domain-containing protein [Amycolatopsis alkalitolerans]TNC28641.1 hypothetical protein FG385_05135 [Amycolatopsis alkalitolerans]